VLERTTEAARPITKRRLASVERTLGVELPNAYRNFLLTFNGGRPFPAHFVLSRGGASQWTKIHFFFGVDDDTLSCDLLWNYNAYKNRLPAGVIPIAGDEFGNRFCLDLRVSRDGPVLFWDHELELHGQERALTGKVADTFTDWLQQLTVRA
jgi:cell wall assembly regulator SMI1